MCTGACRATQIRFGGMFYLFSNMYLTFVWVLGIANEIQIQKICKCQQQTIIMFVELGFM